MAITKTYGTIKYNINESKWEISQAQPHVCIKLKLIFEKINKTSVQPFLFPNTSETAHDLLWFMDRYPLEVSDNDLKRLKSERKNHISNQNELEAILMPDYIPVDLELKSGEKRDYQFKGKDVYMKTKRILIGDDIGLGKTMIAILSALHKETRPCAVTVQTHMANQWKQKIEEFTNLRVHIIKKVKAYSLPEADVYIFSYSKLRGWVDVFQNNFFKSCVFDEIQELRIAGSQKYISANRLSDSVEYCLGLSASPIYNYGDETFWVINLIKSGALGSYYEFQREWAGGGFSGREVIDPQALGTYLRDNFLMLRRTRKDVGKELPPINKIVHTVECDTSEVDKIEDLARALAIKVTSGSFTERGQASRDLDMLVRKATGVSKARGTAAYVKILLENKVPVILAGWHRAVYEIWLKELAEYNPVMYTGSESPVEKEKSKNAFINGETDLFIISLRSGIGLDGLQSRCSTVVLGELDHSPKVHDQLIGRADREGQDDQVTAIFCVCEEGSDPLIIDRLGIKSSQSRGIIDPLEAISDQHCDESRIKLMAEQYLKKKQNGN